MPEVQYLKITPMFGKTRTEKLTSVRFRIMAKQIIKLSKEIADDGYKLFPDQPDMIAIYLSDAADVVKFAGVVKEGKIEKIWKAFNFDTIVRERFPTRMTQMFWKRS